MKRYPDYFEQESERLQYRAVHEDDIQSWTVFFHQNSFIPFLGIPAGLTEEEMSRQWLRKQLERYQESGLGHLAVIEKSSGKLIGMGGIIPRTIDSQLEYEIAYSIIPVKWGNGYATEIARHMRSAGVELGISDHYISIIHMENTPSMKVAEKNGMSPFQKTSFLDMPVIIFCTKSYSEK
ncbi:MAG: GNAT family N-acetyltransferase [Flavobacteriales bacterium]|nr:GNAT family N-acetyltransferase [Flavobacteriales bacterium]